MFRKIYRCTLIQTHLQRAANVPLRYCCLLRCRRQELQNIKTSDKKISNGSRRGAKRRRARAERAQPSKSEQSHFLCSALWLFSRLAGVTHSVTYIVCSLIRSLQNLTKAHTACKNTRRRRIMAFLTPCLRHSFGHIPSMLPHSLLAKPDIASQSIRRVWWSGPVSGLTALTGAAPLYPPVRTLRTLRIPTASRKR